MTAEDFSKAFSDARTGYRGTVRFLLGLGRGLRHDQAEDLAQMAWTRGWTRISQFRGEVPLPCWINKIALNLLYDALRRKTHVTQLHEVLEAACSSDFDDRAFDIARILHRCCPDHNRALVMFYFEDLSGTEVAMRLGISVKAAYSLLARARAAFASGMSGMSSKN